MDFRIIENLFCIHAQFLFSASNIQKKKKKKKKKELNAVVVFFFFFFSSSPSSYSSSSSRFLVSDNSWCLK